MVGNGLTSHIEAEVMTSEAQPVTDQNHNCDVIDMSARKGSESVESGKPSDSSEPDAESDLRSNHDESTNHPQSPTNHTPSTDSTLTTRANPQFDDEICEQQTHHAQARATRVPRVVISCEDCACARIADEHTSDVSRISKPASPKSNSVNEADFQSRPVVRRRDSKASVHNDHCG